MKRKRDILTQHIKKYKARLNLDGSRMKQDEHYDESYSPVVKWNSIKTVLAFSAMNKWHTKQIDYVHAFPQAQIDREIYMKIPEGFDLGEGTDPTDYVLHIHRKIYGKKDSGSVWNQYLIEKLIKEVGFKQSKIDECMFYKGKTIYHFYIDDSILAGPDEGEIAKIIKDIKKDKLQITEEGDIQDFLGVNINQRNNGSIELTQPHLIKQILKDLRLEGENAGVKTIPAVSSKLLRRHDKSEDFDKSFDFRSVIGKLNYLEKGSRNDIAYITHQSPSLKLIMVEQSDS